jgi:hypothetical protein
MTTGRFAAPEIGRGPRSSLRFKLALTLCLAMALVAACGSTTPAPSSAGSSPTTAATTAAGGQASPSTEAASEEASASASAGSNTFASPLYGYSLVVPPGWQTLPAASAWLTVALEGRCPTDWDCLSGISGEPTIAAAAASVPPGLTLDQWRVRTLVGLPEGCIDSAPPTATTLGGEPAKTWTTTCVGEGLHAIKVVALHAGRGYIVLFVAAISNDLDTDRALLSSILTSFRFTPS